MQQEHSFPACLTFFVAEDSFLQDDPWGAVGPPSLSLWVVVCFTGLVLWYREGWLVRGRCESFAIENFGFLGLTLKRGLSPLGQRGLNPGVKSGLEYKIFQSGNIRQLFLKLRGK